MEWNVCRSTKQGRGQGYEEMVYLGWGTGRLEVAVAGGVEYRYLMFSLEVYNLPSSFWGHGVDLIRGDNGVPPYPTGPPLA